MRETWANLPRTAKKGDIVKDTGDYLDRQGICRKPITIRETLSFTVTHKVKVPPIIVELYCSTEHSP